MVRDVHPGWVPVPRPTQAYFFSTGDKRRREDVVRVHHYGSSVETVRVLFSFFNTGSESESFYVTDFSKRTILHNSQKCGFATVQRRDRNHLVHEPGTHGYPRLSFILAGTPPSVWLSAEVPAVVSKVATFTVGVSARISPCANIQNCPDDPIGVRGINRPHMLSLA